MWGALIGLGGLWLIIRGSVKKRRRAVMAGAGAMLIALWDLWVLYRSLSTHRDAAVRADLVILLPVALIILYKGSKALADRNGS